MVDKNSAWRSPWVIGWVAMVAIFFSMNLFMVFMAVENNPGLVNKDYYERGQDYEKNMLKRQAKDPGWQMKIELPRHIDVGETVTARFTIKDKVNQPVDVEAVAFHAYRPSDATKDFSVPMRETTPGLYEAKLSFPLLGAWDTLVSVKRGDIELNTAKRIGVGIDWQP